MSEVNPQQPGALYPQFGPPFVKGVIDRLDGQEKTLRKLLERQAELPQTVKRDWSLNLDGSGNTPVNPIPVLFEVPADATFVLHRLAINCGDTYTYGSPYTNAAGYVNILVNGDIEDGFGLQSGTGQLPCTFTPGYGKGIHARGNDLVQLRIVTGPASIRLFGRLQGTLVRCSEEG